MNTTEYNIKKTNFPSIANPKKSQPTKLTDISYKKKKRKKEKNIHNMRLLRKNKKKEETHPKINFSPIMVKRMENLRRTVNIGKLQRKTAREK